MTKYRKTTWNKVDRNVTLYSNDGRSATAVTVCKDFSGRIVVTFPYDRSMVEKVKTIRGYNWHPDKKFWSFPPADETLEKILEIFAGKGIQPDKKIQLELPFLIDGVRRAIQAHHYSRRTEQAYIRLA